MVASLTPISRASSCTFRPASCCFNTPMICSVVNRPFFISGSSFVVVCTFADTEDPQFYLVEIIEGRSNLQGVLVERLSRDRLWWSSPFMPQDYRGRQLNWA